MKRSKACTAGTHFARKAEGTILATTANPLEDVVATPDIRNIYSSSEGRLAPGFTMRWPYATLPPMKEGEDESRESLRHLVLGRVFKNLRLRHLDTV